MVGCECDCLYILGLYGFCVIRFLIVHIQYSYSFKIYIFYIITYLHCISTLYIHVQVYLYAINHNTIAIHIYTSICTPTVLLLKTPLGYPTTTSRVSFP